MKTSVVSKEYQNLHKEILNLQEQWKDSLDENAVKPKVDKEAIATGVPVAALSVFNFDIPLYLQWVNEIKALLIKNNDKMEVKLSFLGTVMNEETARRWIDEALAFNHIYFLGFSEEHGVEEWIPQFLAETAIRPYLQLAAEKVQSEIHLGIHGAGCPVCGEPARLAQLEEEGKKELHCPRCLAHWNDKRITCSHCGNDDHKTIKYLTVEGDSSSQIQVCEKCHGYVKIVDTRQFIKKPSAAMLDLTSLHLDFVAQENGYQAGGNGDLEN